MTRRTHVRHQFVDVVPDALVEGVVYICIPYTTAVHLRLCGCGEEVVTPVRPTGCSVTFNGADISLYPSIGNWDFVCRSHYWITRNQVRWDRRWTSTQIAATRRREALDRAHYFAAADPAHMTPSTNSPRPRWLHWMIAGARRLRPWRWLTRRR
jgi:hypothetical protein